MSKKYDKRLLSQNRPLVNQLVPSVNPWATELWKKGCANNWMPTEVPMEKDIAQWKSKDVLTDDERLLVRRCLGFFAGSESLVSSNLTKNVGKYITDPECCQYILRQSFEESLHNNTVVYICDSLNLEIEEVFEAYMSIPSIKAKDDFLMNITKDIGRKDFDIETNDGKREFLRNMITYYIICEGIMFYSGFVMLLALKRQNKMPGIGEQIEYTLRDESLHIEFGVKAINQIKEEYPQVWTKDFEKETKEHVLRAMELEVEYARDILPNGILGLSADMFIDYTKYIANRRLTAIGIESEFGNVKTPFPWMTDVVDLGKCKNFFESRVTEYQTGTLEDDF